MCLRQSKGNLSLSDIKLICEDYYKIADQLCRIDPGEHNMLLYSDRNSLHDVYCTHIKKSLEKEKSIVILSHYETPMNVKQALNEIDIDVGKHQDDHSLIILDGSGIIYKSGMHIFFEYLKSLESLAIKAGKHGIEVLVDMGSFYHLDRQQEIVHYENLCNSITLNSKSSMICCYHSQDLAKISFLKDQIHRCHSKNFIIKEPSISNMS